MHDTPYPIIQLSTPHHARHISSTSYQATSHYVMYNIFLTVSIRQITPHSSTTHFLMTPLSQAVKRVLPLELYLQKQMLMLMMVTQENILLGLVKQSMTHLIFHSGSLPCSFIVSWTPTSGTKLVNASPPNMIRPAIKDNTRKGTSNRNRHRNSCNAVFRGLKTFFIFKTFEYNIVPLMFILETSHFSGTTRLCVPGAH